MHCVAKRLPATVAADFFPQGPSTLHHQAQATTSQAYLYSIHPLEANDRRDSDEEFRKQEQLGEQPWKRPPDGAPIEARRKNADLAVQLGHEHCDESKNSSELPVSSFKCPVKKLEPGQAAKSSSCDKSELVKRNDNEQRRSDSLESVASHESSSSTNEPQCRQARSRPIETPAPATSRAGGLCASRSVIVCTRIVAPPKIDDDQLIGVVNWQTIPLDEHDDGQEQSTESHELREANLSGSERADWPMASWKVRSSQSGQGAAGNKHLAGAEPQEEAKAKAEEGQKPARENEPGGASNESRSAQAQAGQRRRALSDGPPDGRKAPVARERVGSASSFKSLGSFQRSKAQIGKTRAPFMFAGILASMLGSLFFSIGTLCIKLLPDGHGLAEKTKLVFCRGCIMTLLCGATIIYQKSTIKIRRDEIWVNVLRAVLGFLGVYGAYIALKYISMGDSTALVFSSPVWTSLLSHFILNEPLHWIQLLALPASLLGIVLIAHPALLINLEQHAGASERQPPPDVLDVVEVSDLLPASNSTGRLIAQLNQTLTGEPDVSLGASEHFDFEHRWKGIVISLATSFIVSFVYIVLKFRKSTPIQTTTFWLGVATALLSLLVTCFTGFGQLPSGLRNWSLLLCNGLCSWLGQVLLQWALTYEDASLLSVVRTLDVAMNFALSALFLDEQIMWTSVLGASIIALVVVSIMLNSWISNQLCPTNRPALEPKHHHFRAPHDDAQRQELASGESRFSAPSANRQEKAPLEGEITLKLEAPSLRKLRQGELAA